MLNFTAFGVVGLQEDPPIALVVFRYILWPCIIAGAVPVLAAEGMGSLRSLSSLIPLLLVGLISTITGFAPLISLKLLVFWALGMLAAGTIGSRLDLVTAGRGLLAIYGLMVAASVMAVFVIPGLTTHLDEHGAIGGAWAGLFAGKTAFGLILVYCCLFALFVPRVPLFFRAFVFGMALVALYKARSIGADTALVSVCYYVMLTRLVNRLHWPVAIKSILTLVTLLVSAAIAAAAGTLALALIGKDATLSGRTEFWPAWLSRALESPLVGFGPGSFTVGGSPVVVDLAARFESLGYIVTPHNMFIAVFGELGLPGVLAFFLPLLYLALVAPFRLATRDGLFAGWVAFLMLICGIDETREVFGLGINMFLSFLFYTIASRSVRGADDTVATAFAGAGIGTSTFRSASERP